MQPSAQSSIRTDRLFDLFQLFQEILLCSQGCLQNFVVVIINSINTVINKQHYFIYIYIRLRLRPWLRLTVRLTRTKTLRVEQRLSRKLRKSLRLTEARCQRHPQLKPTIVRLEAFQLLVAGGTLPKLPVTIVQNRLEFPGQGELCSLLLGFCLTSLRCPMTTRKQLWEFEIMNLVDSIYIYRIYIYIHVCVDDACQILLSCPIFWYLFHLHLGQLQCFLRFGCFCLAWRTW